MSEPEEMRDDKYAFALLVGVGRYHHLDCDLDGPAADVLSWLHIARDLGIPATNIRLCISPAPDDARRAGLERRFGAGLTFADTTRDALADGLKWLAAKLDGEGGTKGLLTYSGHGTRSAGEELFCPSDIRVEDGALVNALKASEAIGWLGERHSRTRVTAIIDACHSGGDEAGRVRGRWLPWDGADEAPPGAAHPHVGFGDVVLSSSEPGQPSYDMRVVDGWRGAFSWAAANLVHRWGLAEACRGTAARMSFAELIEGCRTTLAAFRVSQTPRYIGPEGDAILPVFSTFDDGAVLLDPRVLQPREIWPDVPDTVPFVQLRLVVEGTENHLGDIYITGNKPPNGWDATAQWWPWSTSNNSEWPQSFTAKRSSPQSQPDHPPGCRYRVSKLGNYQGNGKYGIDTNHYPTYEIMDPGNNGRGVGWLVIKDGSLSVYSGVGKNLTLLDSFDHEITFKRTYKGFIQVNHDMDAYDPMF